MSTTLTPAQTKAIIGCETDFAVTAEQAYFLAAAQAKQVSEEARVAGKTVRAVNNTQDLDNLDNIKWGAEMLLVQAKTLAEIAARMLEGTASPKELEVARRETKFFFSLSS